MLDKNFATGVLGEKYWWYSDLLPDGRTYSEWYYDRFERGMLNIHNLHGIAKVRPYYLYKHDSYEIYRDLDPISKMDNWEKYLKPGWNVNVIAAVDGNAKISSEVPILLPVVGFQKDNASAGGHSDYFIKMKLSPEKEHIATIFENARHLKKGPTVTISNESLPLPKIKGEINWNRLDGASNDNWLGASVGNIKVVRFRDERHLYDLTPEGKCEPLMGEKVFTYHVGHSNINPQMERFCLSRGVVPSAFVKTYVNEDGKVYQMESFTNIKAPGDLIEKNRIIINEETLRYILAEENPKDPRKYSFMHVGHDVAVGVPLDDRVGIIEIDEWLRILRPLVMLHWAGEFTMVLAAGFVGFTVINVYYFYLYKLYRFIDEAKWDPSVRYSCYWDHRHIDVKTLEWAFLNHIREACLVDGIQYMNKYLWAAEHSLSFGYHLWGFPLRMYEWFDLFSGNVVW